MFWPFKHNHQWTFIHNILSHNPRIEKTETSEIRIYPMYNFYYCKCHRFKILLSGSERAFIEGKALWPKDLMYTYNWKYIVEKYLLKFLPDEKLKSNQKRS